MNACIFLKVASPSQDDEDLAMNQTADTRPNFSANRNIKYLTSELSKMTSREERVQVK